MTKRYKFLLKGNKSSHGDFKWKKGVWYKHDGEIELCESGFHCSKGIYQAFSYVQGEILAEVEVKGKHESEDTKDVWQEMRVTKTYKWQKKDSVLFSIFVAYLCLDNFEKLYPEDKRPREAIEAAERYVKEPTEENRTAAESAARSAESAAWSAAWSAARSAESAVWSAAWSAARSAARSAESAAWSAAESAARSAESAAWSAAWSAARSAARSAESAVWSAESAARSAESAVWSAAWSAARSAARSAESAVWSAESAAYKKLDKWMLNHLVELEEIK